MRVFMVKSDVLLFNPKKDYTTIRKLGGSYGFFKYLVVVSKDNNVIAYSRNPQLWVIKAKHLTDEHIQIYGKKNYEKLKDTESLMIFQADNPCKISDIPLVQKVRGMRFATNEESQLIKEGIVKQEAKNLNITQGDVFYNTPKYQQLYKMCVTSELNGVLFNLEKTGELYR